MNFQRLEVINFFILSILLTVLALLVVWPFGKLLALAAILAVLFHPVYRQLEKEIKNPGLAALISIVIISLIVVLPLLVLGTLLFNELSGVYRQAQTLNLPGLPASLWRSLPSSVQGLVSGATQDTGAWFSRISDYLFQSASYLLSHIAGFFLSSFLLLITVYYLLKDGKKIRTMAESALPISPARENLLFQKIELAISGVVRGTFLTALIRGILVFFGFLVFGIPNPVLWSVLFTVVSMIPPAGTGLGIAAAVAYLLLAGHIGAAIGMAVLGIFLVVVLDTILAPKIMSTQIRLHPLLVLFGILGGMAAFGATGLLFGPVIMSVFAAMLDIYRMEIKGYLEK